MSDHKSFLNCGFVSHLIRYKWWYLATLSVVVCALVYRAPRETKVPQVNNIPTYTCTAKVLVDASDQTAAMRNLGVASGGMMKMRSFNSVENEIEAFSSVDYMQRVVERLGLQASYVVHSRFKTTDLATKSPVQLVLAGENPRNNFSFTLTNLGDNKVKLSNLKINGSNAGSAVTGNLGDTLSTPLGHLAIFPTTYIDDFNSSIDVTWDNSITTAKRYRSKLEVALSGKESSVVVLKLTDTDPKRAASVISTLIDVYDEAWIANKNRAAVNTKQFIDERLVVIERELAEVEEVLGKYKADNKLTDIQAIGQMNLAELSHYQAKAFEVSNQISVANFIKDYLNDPANAMTLIPANIGISSSSVDSEIKEYNDLVLQRDRLTKGNDSSNPMVADLNNSITSIRSAILHSIENLISTLELQLARIEGQEKEILNRISSGSGQELQLLSIERQHAITQELYKFLLQKREENELAALVNVGNTQILQHPESDIVCNQ